LEILQWEGYKLHVMKWYIRPRASWILWNDFKQQKMEVRPGIWNARSLYKLGSLKTVSTELPKYKLHLVGAQKVRWEKRGTEPANDCAFFMKRECWSLLRDTSFRTQETLITRR
jgi:hypothetical protein